MYLFLSLSVYLSINLSIYTWQSAAMTDSAARVRIQWAPRAGACVYIGVCVCVCTYIDIYR